MSAVSMKLIPASSARWMIRMLSSCSLLPQSPNIIAPRHSLLTETPVRPSGLCSIIAPSVVNGSRAAAATPARWGWSARLCCGTDEDLVERHAPRPGDGEHDDFRDVLGPDGEVLDELLRGLLGLGAGNVVGELGRHRAGLDHGHANVGLQLLAQRL